MVELTIEQAHRNVLAALFAKEFPANKDPEGPGIRRHRIRVAEELRQELLQVHEWIIGARAAKWPEASDWWFKVSSGTFDYRDEFTRFMAENIDKGFFAKPMIERWQLLVGPVV